MYALERPVYVSDTAYRYGDNPHGMVSFDIVNESTGSVASKINMPIWFNNPNLIHNGMSWHTHRRVFRQLQKLTGSEPKELKINTSRGYRIFNAVNHRSFLEDQEDPQIYITERSNQCEQKIMRN